MSTYKYDVYAAGNAVIDEEYRIKQEFLKQHNIPEDVMTLTNKKTHDQLSKSLDGIPHHRKTCGGSAANTIITLQQLGAKTFFSCKVGNDDYGDFYYKDLISHGVQTNLHKNSREGITGKCIVLVTPDGERTMNTFLGITFQFSEIELSESAIKNSEYLYIEGYLVASPSAHKAAICAHQMAMKYHVKTAMSLSDPNMVTHFKENILKVIDEKIDILFCNEKEALLFTNTDNIADAKNILMKSARTFAITLGAQGALVYDGHEFSHVPTQNVKVVDTTGAGDIFAGAFLYAITHGCNYKTAADLANFAASKVIAKFGPRLNQHEIKQVSAHYNALSHTGPRYNR